MLIFPLINYISLSKETELAEKHLSSVESKSINDKNTPENLELSITDKEFPLDESKNIIYEDPQEDLGKDILKDSSLISEPEAIINGNTSNEIDLPLSNDQLILNTDQSLSKKSEIINSATTKEDLESSFDKKQQIEDESEGIKKRVENEDSESLISTQSSKESENNSDIILPSKSNQTINEPEDIDGILTQEVINSSKINDNKPIKTKDKIKRQSSFLETRKIFESNESKNLETEKSKTTLRSHSFRSRDLEETSLNDIKYSSFTPVKYINPHNRLRNNDNCDKKNKEKEAIESMSPEEAEIYFKKNFTEKRQMFEVTKEEIPKPMGLLKIRGSIILNNNSSTKDTTSTAVNEEGRCESMNKSFRMSHDDKYLTSKSTVLRSNSSLDNPVTDTVNIIPFRMKYNNYSIKRNPDRHTSLYHQFNPQCKRSTHSSTLESSKDINKTKVPLASSITS
ncbi:hypothetical protein H311_01680, partial [Anncaliia algerae PRA109]